VNGSDSFWNAINACLDVLSDGGVSAVDGLTWLTTACDDLGADRPVDRVQKGEVLEAVTAARRAAVDPYGTAERVRP
jgi:hypothetical protein